MEFFHCFDNIIQMLDYIVGIDFIEAGAFERVRIPVQIVNDVCSSVRIDVDADRTRSLAVAAAQIQYFHEISPLLPQVALWRGRML